MGVTAKPKTSRENQNLTAKPKTSWENQIPHGKTKNLTAKPNRATVEVINMVEVTSWFPVPIIRKEKQMQACTDSHGFVVAVSKCSQARS